MIHRSRVVFTVGALAVASAAAATIPWQTWKPVTACLLCGAQDSGEAVVVTPTDAERGIGSGSGNSYARSSASTYKPDAVSTPTADSNGASGRSSSSRAAAAPRGWQPWGSSSEASRFASAGFSGPSAPQGGLWRLMSLHQHHGSGTATATASAHTVVTHAPSPAVNRPVKNPPAPHNSTPPSSNSGSSSGSPGASGTTGTPTASSGDSGSASGDTGSPMAGVPPTDPFHEHQTPPPDPFHGPGFDPGAPAGHPGSIGGGGGLGGGKVSAAPEPGSMLLLSTGVLGIFGILRKRRLI